MNKTRNLKILAGFLAAFLLVAWLAGMAKMLADLTRVAA
jgi:hypothetical protein